MKERLFFKSLASSLVMYERIETTEEKAKAIKGHVEKMVTKVNTNTSEHARKLIQAYLTNEALAKMMTDIAPDLLNAPEAIPAFSKHGAGSQMMRQWLLSNG